MVVALLRVTLYRPEILYFSFFLYIFFLYIPKYIHSFLKYRLSPEKCTLFNTFKRTWITKWKIYKQFNIFWWRELSRGKCLHNCICYHCFTFLSKLVFTILLSSIQIVRCLKLLLNFYYNCGRRHYGLFMNKTSSCFLIVTNQPSSKCPEVQYI